MPSPALSPAHVASRVAASVLGGYVFVWGFTSLLVTLKVAAGSPYEEAQTLGFLLSFLLYLSCFGWAFVAPSLVRVWLLLAGGGALLNLAAWLLSRALV